MTKAKETLSGLKSLLSSAGPPLGLMYSARAVQELGKRKDSQIIVERTTILFDLFIQVTIGKKKADSVHTNSRLADSAPEPSNYVSEEYLGAYFADYIHGMPQASDNLYFRPRGYSNRYDGFKEPVNPVHLMSLFTYFSTSENPSVLIQYFEASLALAVTVLPVKQLVPNSMNVIVGLLIHQTETVFNILGSEENLPVWEQIIGTVVNTLLEEISGQSSEDQSAALPMQTALRKMSEEARGKSMTDGQSKTVGSLLGSLKALHMRILQFQSIDQKVQTTALLRVIATNVGSILPIVFAALSSGAFTPTQASILGSLVFFVLQCQPTMNEAVVGQLLEGSGLEGAKRQLTHGFGIWRAGRDGRVMESEKQAFHTWFGGMLNQIRSQAQ